MLRIFLLSVFLASQAIAGEPTIRPTDTIRLKADAIPKDDKEIISSDYRVDGSGSIRLPYLGNVAVGGLTAAEAAHLIEADYVSGGIFVHPAVVVSIRVPDPLVAEVRVGGPVQHPDKYRMKKPATIEQAFVQAGGWSGPDENGMPPKRCRLTHAVDGQIVNTIIRIHIDPKTKQIEVLDQTWKDYHLMDADEILLPGVWF